MITSDTSDLLKSSVERIAAELKAGQQAKAAEEKAHAAKEAKKELKILARWRDGFWAGALIFFVAAWILSFGHWSGRLPLPTGVVSWLGPGLTNFSILGALFLQRAIDKRNIIFEVRDARPADAEVVGQMVAELQANRGLIQKMREELAANERQRQSDFDQIRESARKLLEGVNERLDKLMGMVDESAGSLDMHDGGNVVGMPNPKIYQLGIVEGERRERERRRGHPD